MPHFCEDFSQNLEELVAAKEKKNQINKIRSINGFNERIQNILFKNADLIPISRQSLMNEIYFQMKYAGRKVEQQHQQPNLSKTRTKVILEESERQKITMEDYQILKSNDEFDYDLMIKLNYFNKSIEEYLHRSKEEQVNQKISHFQSENTKFKQNLGRYLTKDQKIYQENLKDASELKKGYQISNLRNLNM